MPRILLLGADGMLGSALARVLATELQRADILALTRADCDIAAGDWRDLPVAGRDWVLNAAGVTNRRDADADAQWTVNAVFPHALAALCAGGGARLIQFSTDCVFSGAGGPRDEADRPDATDAYGRSKAAGEPPGAMTLRASIVGPEQRRFYNLLCWALRQDRIDGFRNHAWNGLTTVALARAVAAIIRAGTFSPGVRHLFAEDTTKHDLLATACAAFGHGAALRPVLAAAGRDQRLATRHPDFLATLGLPPLAAQLRDCAALSTPAGAWRA